MRLPTTTSSLSKPRGYQQRQNDEPYGQGWRTENFNRKNPYQQPPPQEKPSKLEETLNQFMQASMANKKSNEVTIKNLETQVGKLAKQLAEKQTGPSFSANTQPNPKEHCKYVVTRSGRVVESEFEKEVDDEERIEKESEFMDIFRQLQINIPFSEALEQMPKYAKFMKDLLTKKKKYTEPKTVILDAKCSSIIQSTLPRKESDPRRVTLPVTIGDIHVGIGFVDLGSSINLIPLSIVKRLGIFYLKATRMTLQLADKSTTRPYGVAEDLIVKVDKFLFPVDFVVIDTKEDINTHLILGRPFMKTARMMIDIDDVLMKLRFQDEEVCFDLFEAMKHPKDKGDCFRIDSTEEVIMQVQSQVHLFNPFEKTLTEALEVLNEDEENEIEECLRDLDVSEEINPFEAKMEELKDEPKVDDTKLELKMLPSHLKYAFLEEGGKKLVIISGSLSSKEEEKLIHVLKDNKEAIGWVLSDLKEISLTYCMLKIMVEEDFKLVAQPQRCLNPTMK
ncbi:uncharacterized protein LOC131598342 [Vicia villosa]|uniref:uncharacterized protein LOC131598342 n=1 Tax=Vicia villosa TaxID=3911 RepID=UPI00273C0949|nr:uncharacterized protein LOC131598342 [Vicia villosa]